MPSPTETTVPTSATSMPRSIPASCALMMSVISCAVISAMVSFRSLVERLSGLLEPLRERGVVDLAADAHDEAGEEGGIDGTRQPHRAPRALLERRADLLGLVLRERCGGREARLDDLAV